MKKQIARILLLISVIAGSCIEKAAAQAPNIIFIIGDDISWDDIGAYGNNKIKTPNLDKLAKDGLRFTNMYLTASSCSPSRSSILTGRYPHNTGAAELHSPLPAHLKYFPELLKQQGYFSALVGKWHEGPNTRRAYDTLLVDRKANGEGGELQWNNLLKARPKDKPFFFWLAPFDAHRPWSAKTDGPQHNPETDIAVPPTLVDTKETRQDLAFYYNEISQLDQYVGELRQELERQGIADNTLIIFTADNGRPFPGSKTRLYDAGVKTPFIVSWPAGIKAGQVCESLISSIDIAPTLLEVAGVKPAETVQGTSFATLFKSPEKAFRKYVFAEHNWHDYAAYERSVRSKDFLYIMNKRPEWDNGGPIDANQSPSAKALKAAKASGGLTVLQNDALLKPRPAEEFFDNQKDPLQTKNEVGNKAYAAQVNELRRMLKQWQDETGDTEPANLTPDWYDRETGEPTASKDKRGEMPGAARKADHIHLKGPF
ncbi:sulfatase [Dyadobacter chenwenxiniae]|uniref:Sulfatase n=1 Tax=Dyadobacter chenwenxiniae TaxID=2906456 RepID=A0A9X1PS26_9BACT|nr:sulfatase [Dyadobacter chenwenxiniae]MCF0064623.1 sulfatase [Dyadobacter chenwenxiniae]UON84321.1 sulfatase [Dyadobacter chenwenxiniae]